MHIRRIPKIKNSITVVVNFVITGIIIFLVLFFLHMYVFKTQNTDTVKTEQRIILDFSPTYDPSWGIGNNVVLYGKLYAYTYLDKTYIVLYSNNHIKFLLSPTLSTSSLVGSDVIVNGRIEDFFGAIPYISIDSIVDIDTRSDAQNIREFLYYGDFNFTQDDFSSIMTMGESYIEQGYIDNTSMSRPHVAEYYNSIWGYKLYFPRDVLLRVYPNDQTFGYANLHCFQKIYIVGEDKQDEVDTMDSYIIDSSRIQIDVCRLLEGTTPQTVPNKTLITDNDASIIMYIQSQHPVRDDFMNDVYFRTQSIYF